MQHAAARSRSYGGKSADQRRRERRGALIEAARELWREQGWAAVTMRGVCSRARVTDRYFYENFSDRDDLLGAIWDITLEETLGVLYAAIAPHAAESPLVQLHAVLAAMVHRIADDPGDAQILFGDHAGSAALERRRRDTIQTAVQIFLDLSRPYLRADADITKLRVSVMVGIGGFVETVLAWRSGTIALTVDELVESLDLIGNSLAAEFLE